MTSRFINLSTRDLEALAHALRSGRLPSPYSQLLVAKAVPGSVAAVVGEDLRALADSGFGSEQIAILLDAVRADRKSNKKLDEVVELVTTGPEAPGTINRDTSVVVRDLFRQAKESVLIVGYAIYQGQQVFKSLAERMEEIPSLDVKMCLNMTPDKTTDVESLIVRRFADQFKSKHWPNGARLPRVFFDPRSIDPDKSQRASLHAKCIVVDGKEVFISSANFTERAQNRNIEVGVKLASSKLADQLTEHFVKLIDDVTLRPVPLFTE